MNSKTDGYSFEAEPVPAKRFHAEHPQPVVLHFQPERFSLLEEPEDLRTWEALLVERVGLTGAVGKAIAEDIVSNGGTCCESGAPSNDCDVD
jgi:hypothetical protein